VRPNISVETDAEVARFYVMPHRSHALRSVAVVYGVPVAPSSGVNLHKWVGRRSVAWLKRSRCSRSVLLRQGVLVRHNEAVETDAKGVRAFGAAYSLVAAHFRVSS
jgi:hypothetical protein